MLFYMFTNVFQNMSQRGSVLMHFSLSLSLEVQSGIPRFRTPARAGNLALERRIRAPASLCTVLQSARAEDWALERNHVSRSSGSRAEISPIQYFYSTRERESLRSSGYLCCMSARARKPALERDSVFLKCF